MTETKQEINEQGEALGLGERLKQAREAKKLTIAEVAKQLRVTHDCIDAIEREAWGVLPGRTYARGYFISYVKLMGLPEEALLSLFNIQYAEPVKVSSTVNQKNPSAIKSKLLVLIIPLILLTTVWFGWQFLVDNKQKNKETTQIGMHDRQSEKRLNNMMNFNLSLHHNSEYDS